MSHLSVRQSAFSHLGPLTLSRISVSFAVIAAVWLTVASTHGEMIALVAAVATVVASHAGRAAGGQRPATSIEWGLVVWGVLGEFVIYAGMAAAISFHPGAQPGLAGNS